MKKFLSSFAAFALAVILMASTFASSGYVQKTLLYDDIKITLDGNELKPADVNGNYIEPFIIDGTTYLPVRGISGALGLDVDWDDAARTVVLKTRSVAAEPILLYDENGVKLTYNGYGYDEYGDLDVKFLIENNTPSVLSVSTYRTAINDYMLSGSLYDDITAGKKLNGKVKFYSYELDENNIADIENIEIYFDFYNADTFENVASSLIVTITPDGAVATPAPGEPADETLPYIFDTDAQYGDYIDFVKANGVCRYDIYSLTHSESISDDDQNVDYEISLLYDEPADLLQLALTVTTETDDEKSDYFLTVDLTDKADEYNWEFLMESGGVTALFGGIVKANFGIFDSDAVEITDIDEEYVVIKDILKGTVSMYIGIAAASGDVLFIENDSDLSLAYFGISV